MFGEHRRERARDNVSKFTNEEKRDGTLSGEERGFTPAFWPHRSESRIRMLELDSVPHLNS